MKLESGVSDSEAASMETDVCDRQGCFILFQKFVREVCKHIHIVHIGYTIIMCKGDFFKVDIVRVP